MEVRAREEQMRTEQKRYSVLLSRRALDLHLKGSFYDVRSQEVALG